MNRHHQDDEHTSYGRHALGVPNGVRVATILEQAVQEGRPLWLDWGDQGDRGLVTEQPQLPRRPPRTGTPRRPIEYDIDPMVLEAVLRGLRRL